MLTKCHPPLKNVKVNNQTQGKRGRKITMEKEDKGKVILIGLIYHGCVGITIKYIREKCQ